MQQEIAYTQNSSLNGAVADIQSQLHNHSTSYNLILFFASAVYDFAELTDEFHRLYPNTQVIGASAGGEIHKNGFNKHGLLVTTMSDPDLKISSVLIDNVNTYPILHKDKIEHALQECDIDITRDDFTEHSFALTFTNGLRKLEEYFLSILYAAIGNHKFQVIGGTAGDDYRFFQTKISLNGVVSYDGAIVAFINTKKRFHFYKVNFFKPTGKTLHITKCNMEDCVIQEINGEPPLTAYAKALGVSSTTLLGTMFDHPLGRTFGSETYITSLANFNPDKTLNMSTRVINNSDLDILEPDDILSVFQNACDRITADFENPGFIFLILCIGNMISYEQHGYFDSITEILNRNLKHFCGFAAYGEQLNQVHLSQSMLVLVMEE